jgi:hypothetical protein
MNILRVDCEYRWQARSRGRCLPLVLFLTIIPLLAGCSGYIRGTELSEGERLYRSRCSACHMLIEKDALSRDGWELAVKRYGEKLKEEEKKKILEYLTEK